jgi:acylphosphatase
METKRVRLIIRGRVQGVGYRASALEEGERLGLRGWVRNLPDGAVELEAEGARAVLDRLIAWCGHGPRGARVDGVTPTWVDEAERARLPLGTGFQIRR